VIASIYGIELFPKEAAIASRGLASASTIAAAVGISRNAVIGHWFRDRHKKDDPVKD
jgi:hypothetical protein